MSTLKQIYDKLESQKRRLGNLASEFYAVRAGILEIEEMLKEYAEQKGDTVMYSNKPIFDTIQETKGVSFTSLARELGMTPNQLAKHLDEPLLPCERDEVYQAIENIKERRMRGKTA